MRFKFLNLKFLAVLILVVALSADVAQAARIKDLVNIKGVRNNQLIGFGLVIGLQGTGDRATNVFFSIQAVVNMLRKLGVTVPEARIQQLQFKNVATVLVTADLQAFSKQGDHLDVLVSSLANATSLQGGTLLLCPLKGPDGEVYAVAQGALSIGGFSVQGAARGVQKNHLTVGRVANGGIVEKEIPTQFNSKKGNFPDDEANGFYHRRTDCPEDQRYGQGRSGSARGRQDHPRRGTAFLQGQYLGFCDPDRNPHCGAGH